VFTDDRIYSQVDLAAAVGRTVRSLRNWRDRGLLPEPDLLIGGREPAWLGKTLNASPAFAKPDAARIAGLRPVAKAA
jgi:hypothetical protein